MDQGLGNCAGIPCPNNDKGDADQRRPRCFLTKRPRKSLFLGFFHRTLGSVGGFLGGSRRFGGLVGRGCGVAGSCSVGGAIGSRSGIGGAFGRFHRAVSGAFDGRGVFGGCGGVVGSLFTASGEAHRSGENERQSDRFFHAGNPSRFELIDRHRN